MPRVRSVTRPPMPRLGPGGRCWFDEGENRWRVGLTDLGREWADAYLAAYGGQPIRLLIRLFPRVWRVATSNHIPLDDLRQACCLAVLDAAARFHPDRGAAFATVAPWWIRRAVQCLLPRAAMATPRPGTVVYEIGEHADYLPPAEPDRWEEAAGARADLEPHLAGLDPKRLEALGRTYGVGGYDPHRSYSVVGESMGVSGERARQLTTEALILLRRRAIASRKGRES